MIGLYIYLAGFVLSLIWGFHWARWCVYPSDPPTHRVLIRLVLALAMAIWWPLSWALDLLAWL